MHANLGKVVRLAGVLVLAAAVSAEAQMLNYNVTGIPSVDALGAPGNQVSLLSLSPTAVVTGLGWNVTLTAFSPSWRSDMAINFSDSAGGQSYVFRPGLGDDASGGASYSSAVMPIPSITLGVDGLLRLEFFEAFDDFNNAADGEWGGSVVRGEISELTIQYVPGPGGVAVVLIGLCTMRRRARA